uniref:Uncharacterized protein n=1 Tax=Elaeophora elaphi TaxID=1147741 RepID=A0A0R3S164_9BILA
MTKQWIKGRLNGKQLRLARRTTTTAAPIACLLEWDPSKCQIFHHKRPLFAPHLAYSKTTHGLITPVLPISGKAEESEESKSSSLALLPTSELALTTSTVTGKPAQTTIAQPEQLEKFSQEQEYHQATVNGKDNNYSNCANATIAISTLSTTSPPLHPSLASTTAPPLPSSSSSSTAIITNKIMQITSAISQQPNRNYFEDLWSDIAGPPAVIVDSDQQESKNKTTRTTSPSSSSIVANLIDSNLSTRPLTFPTLQYTQPPTQKSVSSSSSLHKEAKTPSSEKRLTSTTPKIASFLLNISTKSSLVIDNAEEGRKRIEGPEAKNWGNVNSEHKSQRVLTVPTVPSSTFRHRIRTTLVSHTIYAVRPTTPMGELITDTVKTPAAPTDFPRTALISIASLSVIIIIAIVVFCVFRCRQSGPSTDQYPMVCSGKQSGYAPIPAELSPPMMREPSRQNTAGPFFHNRVNQLDGYQPIKGAVIPNGNNSVNSIKGNCASSTNGRKKEFKEWYV